MVKQQNRRTVHIQMKYSSQSIGNCIVSWTVVCDAYRIQFCSEGEGSTKLHSDAHNFEENWNLVEWVSPCLWSGSPRCWRPRPSRQPRLGHRLRQPGHQDLGLHGQHGQHGQQGLHGQLGLDTASVNLVSKILVDVSTMWSL